VQCTRPLVVAFHSFFAGGEFGRHPGRPARLGSKDAMSISRPLHRYHLREGNSPCRRSTVMPNGKPGETTCCAPRPGAEAKWIAVRWLSSKIRAVEIVF
jgi:hypothetical protein